MQSGVWRQLARTCNSRKLNTPFCHSVTLTYELLFIVPYRFKAVAKRRTCLIASFHVNRFYSCTHTYAHMYTHHIIIIIIIITSNDDIQPSTVITNQSPSGIIFCS